MNYIIIQESNIENMTEQEHKNRQFAKALAEICLYYGMDKLPIFVNSQQYEYFVEEWNKLIEEMKK